MASSDLKTYRDVLSQLLTAEGVDQLCSMGDSHRIFEAIVILLGITRTLPFGTGIPQKGKFKAGTISDMETIREILDKSIFQGGDKSDFTVANETDIFPVSVKSGENITQSTSDVESLENCRLYPGKTIHPYLVVQDKATIINKRKSEGSIELEMLHKRLHDEGRIYDKGDMEIALKKFQNTFKGNQVDAVIEHIDVHILHNTKIMLKIRLHQQMTKLSIINSIKREQYQFIIGHKPRSGKSITSLSIVSELIRQGRVKKCLFMTSIPETLTDYMKTINKYLDFTNLSSSKIVNGKNVLDEIPADFEGILFSSVQFLKNDKEGVKDNWLMNIDADIIIIDESHYGGSTFKTNKRILRKIMNKNKNKILICISGTPNKTKQFYKISRVHEWSFMDENFMKNIDIPDIYGKMVERHGSEFIECLSDVTLDKDYSGCPVPVLIRPEFPKTLEEELSRYNLENNTEKGLSPDCFFKLREQKKNKNAVKYTDTFELEGSAAGNKLLTRFLEWFISNDPNSHTVMTEVEETQTGFGSRVSKNRDPLLTIMFLPKVGNIEMLQKALVKFVSQNGLWENYRIAYSNCKSKYAGTLSYKSDMNIMDFVNLQLGETKREGKDGLILLLGDQGSLGLTFKECDTLFMLDNSKNMDYYTQRLMRAMTDAKGKTIGCIVDMNFQRTLMLINNQRKAINKDKSVAESIYDLITLNIFHFNPKMYNFMNYDKTDISVICSRYSEEIKIGLTDEAILKTCISIKCDELELLLKDLRQKNTKAIQHIPDIESIEGLNKGMEAPGKSAVTISGEVEVEPEVEEPDEDDEDEDDEDSEERETNAAIFFKRAVCLMSLLTRTNNKNTLKTMFESLNGEKQELYMEILLRDIVQEKEVFEKSNLKDIIYNNLMNISEDYSDFVEQIKQIYSTSTGENLRELLAKNFKPTEKDKKDRAEVSTPVFLVNDKIAKVPASFWQAELKLINKKKVITMPRILDPCCGKATYLPPLFDKLFAENIDLFDGDAIECCKEIMTKSLYYGDINPLNVCITNIIMECHVQSYCGIEPDYKFNSYIGNALELDINTEWHIQGFNMVVGNPPYNDDSGNKGKSHILWDKFIFRALDYWLLPGGYLLYVHPSLWRQKGHDLFNKMTEKQIHYLEIHNVEDGLKTFKCATRYDWYLLENVARYKETEIKGEDGISNLIDLKDWKFIPNKMFEEIKELISENEEELLDIHNYRSNYGADKSWVSGIKGDVYKYPVVYSINKNNELSLKYSSVNDKGHFGLSKFIFSNGAGLYSDPLGEYGLTQWAYCIYDKPENLPHIETMFKNKTFEKIMEALHFDSSSYNISVMKMFKRTIYSLFK